MCQARAAEGRLSLRHAPATRVRCDVCCTVCCDTANRLREECVQACKLHACCSQGIRKKDHRMHTGSPKNKKISNRSAILVMVLTVMPIESYSGTVGKLEIVHVP